jgi:hypothetical protein
MTCGPFGCGPAWSRQAEGGLPDMAKHGTHTGPTHAGTTLDLGHLRREARTALELAVIALAPTELVDRLATTAGLLEALVELPIDSAPVIALVPRVQSQAKSSLEDWQKWRKEHLENKIPRG